MAERVWDRFLTEQDKLHLAASGDRKRRVGFGAKPALVIVDMYRGVFGDKPEPLLEAIKTWPGSCGLAAWNALPSFQTLLAEARAAHIPIVHVTAMDRRRCRGLVGQARRIEAEIVRRPGCSETDSCVEPTSSTSSPRCPAKPLSARSRRVLSVARRSWAT